MQPDKTSNCLDLAAFTAKLDAAGARWSQRKQQLEDQLTRMPVALFGYGGKGRSLAHHIRRHASAEIAIFDSAPDKRALAAEAGFKTIDSLEDLVQGPWLSILGACQAQIQQKHSISNPHMFFQEAACLFGAPHFAHCASDFGRYVAAHVTDLYAVYQALHGASRERFLHVLCFRLSSDPIDLTTTRAPSTEMWLDIPNRYRRRPYQTVLDVGAYDGDTLVEFSLRFAPERGIAVEANHDLFDAIRSAGERYAQGIKVIPMAAWSRNTRLKFEEVRFGMIQVTESPEGMLEAAPIDAAVTERVDFLKMDIEGAEAEALTGCEELLRRWLPDLAIAAYHRPEDIVSIWRQINAFGYSSQDFSFHFGHYSDCLDDSILYVCKAV